MRQAVREAAKLLRSGGLVAFPTDTVYGVAALPWNVDAVLRLYEVKQRPSDLPIPLLLSDADQLSRVATLPRQFERLLTHFWPGELTLVLPKTESVSDAISPRSTVATRIPDLPLARQIIREAGGVLAVTSANISGQPSPITAQEVEEQLGERIDLILDGGPCRGGIPSTILDCSVSPPRLLRRGAIKEMDLRKECQGRPMDKNQPIIQDILAKIVAGYDPQKIILFGSYAYGEPDEDSDIDLLIIKDTDEPPIKRWMTVKRLVRDRSRRTSVSPLVYTAQELEKRLAIKDFFIQEILEKGKTIWMRH